VRTRSARILGALHWTNALLGPLGEAMMELVFAVSRDQQQADECFDNFNRPERQWRRISSAKGIRRWLAEKRLRAPQVILA
jgi:hypothetical protein